MFRYLCRKISRPSLKTKAICARLNNLAHVVVSLLTFIIPLPYAGARFKPLKDTTHFYYLALDHLDHLVELVSY